MLFYSERQGHDTNKKWWPIDRVECSAVLLCRDTLIERWQSFGYFLDKSLFLYCDEIELAMWCRRVGKKSIIAGDLVVYHKVSASSSNEEGKTNRFLLSYEKSHIKLCGGI